MRARFVLGLLGLVTCASASATLGCHHYYDEYYLSLVGTGGTGGTSGTGGGDGGHVNCDPATGAVDESCGVFASAGAPPGGTGTKTSPYSSLQTAIGKASGKYVYACASAPFAEAVMISAPLQLYGGFANCTTDTGWSWSQDARTALKGPADTVALTIAQGADPTSVEGFAITAASPSDLTMGGSSIAVAVDNLAATLDHCDVTASNAAAGVNGSPPSGSVMPGLDAPTPDHTRLDACINPGQLVGGAAGIMMCGAVATSGATGGKGGITGTMSGNGQAGGNGSNPATSPPAGMDGIGGTGQTDPAGACQIGDPGAPGTNGPAGNGGSGKSDTLALAGIINKDANDGNPGTPGQGGGGGGGAKSGMFCAGGTDGNGASGGGGGAGGCGGMGGPGGKAGGSSVAIISLGTKLVLTEVTLVTGQGGKGGDGAINQTGGSGGSAAKGGTNSGMGASTDGCKGGDGGKGGNGGPGGGGRGGNSIGIAYASAPTTMPTLKMSMVGTPGGGGIAGSGAPATSNGALGSAGQCWDFTTRAACNP